MIQGLSKRLMLSRVNSELSRKQVAESLDLSESAIGLYESGNRQPSLETLMKLSSLYNVSADYLLGCEMSDKNALSLSGLTEKQVNALMTVVKCFRNQ